jgi:hypothetical protein
LNGEFLKCPFCSCQFLTQADLDSHLKICGSKDDEFSHREDWLMCEQDEMDEYLANVRKKIEKMRKRYYEKKRVRHRRSLERVSVRRKAEQLFYAWVERVSRNLGAYGN